jgi:hypothetical protein
MDPQTIFLPAKPRVHRKRPNVAPSPVSTLTLVAAEYIDAFPAVVVTFDRAVDVAGFDPAAITVNDAGNEWQLSGAGPVVVLSPTSVRLMLVVTESFTGPSTTLTASAANGIVAADDDAAPWAGCTALVLPFP